MTVEQIIIVSTYRVVATQLTRRAVGGSYLKRLWEADLNTLSCPVYGVAEGIGPSLTFRIKPVNSAYIDTYMYISYHVS
jgi:hypothetical protein